MYICNKNQITGFIQSGELKALLYPTRWESSLIPLHTYTTTLSGAEIPQRCR